MIGELHATLERTPSVDVTARHLDAGSVADQIAAVADAASDIITITDTEFRPTYVNPAGRAFFGLDPDTPAGLLDLYAGIDPAIRDGLRGQVRSALLATGSWHCEYTLTAPHTRTRRAVSAQYSALFSPKGDALGFAVVCRTIFNDPHQTRLTEQAKLQDELSRAIELDQFELFFQPVIDTGDRQVCGHEALLRWNHPTRGRLEPAAFLSAIESADLTRSIGTWTINAAARAVAAFERADVPTSVAVNLFSTQLVTPDLIDTMRGAASAARIDVARLAIEVSEDTLMSDVRAATPVFEALRAAGIMIAIDDFGTGYSNLARLQELDVDFIKIDQSIVTLLDRDPRSQQLFTAVMGLAHALNVHALAEGIETAAQLDTLASLGCRFAQGYHTGHPQPLTQSVARLRSRGLGPDNHSGH